MVLCFIALPLFAVLGIFSVKYRQLTLDSVDCMFKTVTLRKCSTGLDKKIKAHITGSIFRYSPWLSKLIRKHFAIFSWILVILITWSLVVSSIGIYNYAVYGNCNGPDSTDFCIFDPVGQNTGCSEIDYTLPETLTKPTLDSDDPVFGNPNASLQIIYFGCYTCENTKLVEPTVKQILNTYGDSIGIHFKTFIIPNHDFAYDSAVAAECAKEQGDYFSYHDALFELETITNESLYALASDLELNESQFDTCFTNQTYSDRIDQDILQGVNAGIPGTPTFFIGEDEVVGTKPSKTFETLIDKYLE